jgi:adenylosuccinate lyase
VRSALLITGVNPDLFESLRNIYKNFLLKMRFDQRNRKVTNHDVKAVEYFIKDAFEKLGFSI